MRAYHIHHFGSDGLTVVDRPDPVAECGQVVVEIKAVSLNYRDLLVLKGVYNPKLRLPIVPISDGAGVVVAVGPGVTRWKTGDRVAASFVQKWIDGPLTDALFKSSLGGGIDGVLAERVAVPEDGLVAIPEHLGFEEAATLPCAALTAWNALVFTGQVRAGDTVLVQGTGGVSLFALQLAKASGARVIATSSQDEKLERVRTLGASDTINYRTTPEWGERVRELTGGVGVDQVIEVGGAGTLPQSLRAVRTAGYIALIGVLTGGAGQVNPMPLLMKNIRLQGIFVGSRAMFEAMNRAIALNRIQPVVDRVFSFADVPAAYAHLESGAHFGKVVIRLG